MSYNGIGLSTARGSGTNGYVQRNLSLVRKAKKAAIVDVEYKAPEVKKPNASIIEHERLRKIESIIYEYSESLKEHSYSEDEIQLKCQHRREELLNGSIETSDETSNHALMLKKEKEIEKLRAAFKINPDRIEGDYAFIDKKKNSDEKRKPTGNWLLRDNDIRDIEQTKKYLTSNNNVTSMALGKERLNRSDKPINDDNYRNHERRDDNKSKYRNKNKNSRSMSRSRSPSTSRSEYRRNRSRSPRR